MEEVKQNCTFQPKIIEMDPKLSSQGLDAQKALLNKDQPKDKCLALYQLSKDQKKKEAAHKKEDAEEKVPENGSSATKEQKKVVDETKKTTSEKKRKGVKVKANTKAIDSTVTRMIKARKVQSVNSCISIGQGAAASAEGEGMHICGREEPQQAG